MTEADLLDQVLEVIHTVLSRPKMCGLNPYAAETEFASFLQVALSLETGDKLSQSFRRIEAEIWELTKDVPANPEHYRHLCEERVIPERKASFELLQERGRQLCARLLVCWDNAGDTTDGPAS